MKNRVFSPSEIEMKRSQMSYLSSRSVLARSRALGADIVGVANWQKVMAGPSYAIQSHLPSWKGVGAVHSGWKQEPTLSFQPRSVIIVGVAHPENQPELDWWQNHLPGKTLGNKALIKITNGLASWLEQEHGVAAAPLAYHLERGGIFLKDAAVLAGLGVVGRNNLFLCPDFGPRVRLRALSVEIELEPSDPNEWDPCRQCPEPCRHTCPQKALDPPEQVIETPAVRYLPARNGAYQRLRCNRQMETDITNGLEFSSEEGDRSKQVRYCRRCELVCPVGR